MRALYCNSECKQSKMNSTLHSLLKVDNVTQANDTATIATAFASDNLPTATAFLIDKLANLSANHAYDNMDEEPQSWLYQSLKTLTNVMTLYFTPILAVVGTIGNILSVIVFFGTKLKKLSSSYYLAFLAIFDTGFLWCNFIQWLNFFNVNFYARNGFCQLFTWLSNACSVLSVWLVVAFTIERFVAVLYPLKRQTLCTVRRARSIICYLVVFNAINSAPLIMLASSEYSPVYKNHLICVMNRNYGVSKLL